MANKNDLGRSLAKDLLSHHPHPHNLHHPMHLSTFNDHLGNNKDDHHPSPLDFPSVSGAGAGGGSSVAEMPQQPKSAADLLKALSVPNQFPGAASNQLLQNLLSGLPGLPGVPGLSPIANSVAAAALAAALASSSSSNKDDTTSAKDQLHSKIQSEEMVSETEAGTVNGDATDRPADNNLDRMDQATINIATNGEFHFQFKIKV